MIVDGRDPRVIRAERARELWFDFAEVVGVERPADIDPWVDADVIAWAEDAGLLEAAA